MPMKQYCKPQLAARLTGPLPPLLAVQTPRRISAGATTRPCARSAMNRCPPSGSASAASCRVQCSKRGISLPTVTGTRTDRRKSATLENKEHQPGQASARKSTTVELFRTRTRGHHPFAGERLAMSYDPILAHVTKSGQSPTQVSTPVLRPTGGAA